MLVALLAVPLFVAPAAAAPTVVAVRALDYELKGIPRELKVGKHQFTFVNEGEQVHEVVVFKKKSSKTWGAIFQMEQEEAEQHVKFIGATFAKPGEEGKPFAAWLKPGKYIGLCFAQDDRNSKPHYMKGMMRKFSVSR